jgi:hypothetical protein
LQRGRSTIDDPENDIYDDEIYGDEVSIPKEKADDNKEKFEKPW